MENAQIFIECNSAHPVYAMKHGYDVISKHLALQAIDIQKKADAQFFRAFLMRVIALQLKGQQIDLESEFKSSFENV